MGLFYSAVFARYCGATIKGEIAYINGIIAIGAIVITFGMHQAYPYYRRKYDAETYKNIFWSIIVTLFTLYAIASILVVVILFNHITFELVIAIVLMPILGYSNVLSYISIVEKPNCRNTIFMWIHVFELLYTVVLWLCTDSNFFGAVSAFAVAEILKAIVYTVVLRPRFCRFSRKQVIELYSYGFFPMLGLLMTTLNYKVDVFMLKKSSEVTLSEIGVYSIGVTLAEKVLLFPDSIKQILMSKLAKGKTHSEVAKVSRICFFVSFLCTIAIIVSGKLIIDILYGEEYINAYGVTVVCVMGTMPMVFFKMIGQYNIINKKQIYNVVMLSVSILINICFNMLLVPKLGIIGAAIGTAVGHLVCAIIFLIYFSRVSGLRIREIVFVQKSDVEVLVTKFKREKRR